MVGLCIFVFGSNSQWAATSDCCLELPEATSRHGVRCVHLHTAAALTARIHSPAPPKLHASDASC